MVFCNTVIRDSCIPVLRGFLGRDQLIQTSAAGSEATLLGVGCPFESEISSLARDRISSWDLKALPFPWSRGVHRLRRLGRLAHRRQSVQRAQGWAPSSNKQKPLSAQAAQLCFVVLRLAATWNSISKNPLKLSGVLSAALSCLPCPCTSR